MLANDPAAQEAHENAMVSLQRSRLSDMYLTYMLEKNHQYSGFLCLEARKKLLLFSNSLLYGKPLVDAGGFKTKAPSLAAVFKKKQTQEGRSYTRRKIKRVALGAREQVVPSPPAMGGAAAPAIAITPDKLALMKKQQAPFPPTGAPGAPGGAPGGQPGMPPSTMPPVQPGLAQILQQNQQQPNKPNVAAVTAAAAAAEKAKLQNVIAQASPDQLRKMAQLLANSGINMDFSRQPSVGPPMMQHMAAMAAMLPPQLGGLSAPLLQQQQQQQQQPPPQQQPQQQAQSASNPSSVTSPTSPAPTTVQQSAKK